MVIAINIEFITIGRQEERECVFNFFYHFKYGKKLSGNSFTYQS